MLLIGLLLATTQLPPWTAADLDREVRTHLITAEKLKAAREELALRTAQYKFLRLFDRIREGKRMWTAMRYSLLWQSHAGLPRLSSDGRRNFHHVENYFGLLRPHAKALAAVAPAEIGTLLKELPARALDARVYHLQQSLTRIAGYLAMFLAADADEIEPAYKRAKGRLEALEEAYAHQLADPRINALDVDRTMLRSRFMRRGFAYHWAGADTAERVKKLVGKRVFEPGEVPQHGFTLLARYFDASRGHALFQLVGGDLVVIEYKKGSANSDNPWRIESATSPERYGQEDDEKREIVKGLVTRAEHRGVIGKAPPPVQPFETLEELADKVKMIGATKRWKGNVKMVEPAEKPRKTK